MRDIPLLDNLPPQEWYCPNCAAADVTVPLAPGSSRYHACPGLHGLTAPLVRRGVRASVVAEERQDYLNGDLQATGDNGRVYMAVRTLRDDGDDVTVFAGIARADVRM